MRKFYESVNLQNPRGHKAFLGNIFGGLTDVIYPKTCLSCKTKLKQNESLDSLICLDCWSKIKRNAPPFCIRCGKHLEKHNLSKNICPACTRKQLHFDRAFSPSVYEGTLKELIHQFKYKGKGHIGKPLSKLMLHFIKEYRVPVEYVDLIVPVPLHKARLRQREFNQAHILSNHLGKELSKTVSSDVLIRNRSTRTQTELEPEMRFNNVKGSFSVTNTAQVKGKNILLVDDVLTTGATCSEAAYALKDSGAGIVFVMTLAN